MSRTRVLGGDTNARRVDLTHEGHHGDIAVETKQDVQPIIEVAKAEFNLGHRRFGEGQTRVARIPNVIMDDLIRRGITKDPKAFKRWLDHPDNRVFRTHPGKLSK